MYSRFRVLRNDSMRPFYSGACIRMDFRSMPKREAAFLNFLPAYWDPLSRCRVSLEQSGLATVTASTSDSTAMPAVARVLNRQDIHCLVKMSGTLKQ